jgi:lysyl-tRNA synthetase class 1
MSEQFKFWLNRAVDDIEAQHPDGEIVLSSGFGPSGIFHIGHMREVLTVDALLRGLKQRGRQAKHLMVLDDMDALRKVPANVDAKFEEYLGMPVYLVPAPDGSDRSYADFFFDEFHEAATHQGVEATVLKMSQEYANGNFTDAITKVLNNPEKIRNIIEEISHRQLKKDWVPVQIIDDENKVNNWQFAGYDAERKIVKYIDSSGSEGEVSYERGRVKLNWRIDWPARWAIYGVDVEPFGRDHATKGGSYDTGSEIIREIFDAEPPMAFPYEFVMLKGHTKKMSASKGTGIIPNDMLEIMPPQVLRYMIMKNRPALSIYVDVGQNFGRIYDEFVEVEQAVLSGKPHEFEAAYKLASEDFNQPALVDVPFNHLVACWQASQKSSDKTLELIQKSHGDSSKFDKNLLESELEYIEAWLNKYAPEEMKFEIQKSLPNVELSDNQDQLLSALAEKLKSSTVEDGEAIHNLIYELKDDFDLEPKAAFQAVYRVILGKDSGPKAGWFISSLDRDWVIKRLEKQE